MQLIRRMIKGQLVMLIAGAAAAISAFFAPPSAAWLRYIDYGVLSLLFCLMLVVAGLEKTGLFKRAAAGVAQKAGTSRLLFAGLVLLCFFSSALITNDVALIAFVPFTAGVLAMTGQNRRLPIIVVLETMAANLGSALTPVGNPQNLYLYSYFRLGTAEFFKVTSPIFAAGLAVTLLATLIIPSARLEVIPKRKAEIKAGRSICLYAALFIVCLLGVFRIVDYKVSLAVVTLAVLAVDRSLFRRADYGLLATFVFFFIFTGNISGLDPVRRFAEGLLSRNTLLASAGVSQIISNVPAAVLLSGFTKDWAGLLAGVSIGGLGTPVASLASLISYRIYASREDARPLNYLGLFSAFNVSALLLLLAAASIIY